MPSTGSSEQTPQGLIFRTTAFAPQNLVPLLSSSELTQQSFQFFPLGKRLPVLCNFIEQQSQGSDTNR